MILKPISTLVNYDTLYRMEDPYDKQAVRLSKSGYSDWLTLEQARSLLNGSFVPNDPLRLRVYQGSLDTDLLWSGLISILCISARAFNLLKVNHTSGWDTYPVDLIDDKTEFTGKYYGFSVKGKEYVRDKSRSEVIVKKPKTPNGRPRAVYKGLYFDDLNWDGSDIFLIKQNGIAVTEKVREIFTVNKVSNVKFTPLLEIEVDVGLDKYEKT